MKEIKTLKEAIDIYNEIDEEELKLNRQCQKAENQKDSENEEWINAVYRVMDFPSYDKNWNPITMSKELLKEFNDKKLYCKDNREIYEKELSNKTYESKIKI